MYTELLMHLDMSETPGVMDCVITELPFLLGVCYESVITLLNEIVITGVITREELPDGKVRLRDDAMVARYAKSAVKSRAGSEAMKKRWGKGKKETEQPVITSVITDDITHNGNGNNNDNRDSESGGAGGESEREPETVRINSSSYLSVDDCLQAFLETNICAESRDVILMQKCAEVKRRMDDKLPRDLDWEYGWLLRWGKAFNQGLKAALQPNRVLHEWASHFFNWMMKRDTSKEPEKLHEYANNGNSSNGSSAKAAGAAGRGGTLNDLAQLKRGAAPGGNERTELTSFELVD
jgi:hypothetical protein